MAEASDKSETASSDGEASCTARGSLFRRPAIEHAQRSGRLGDVIVPIALSAKLIAITALVVAGALVAFVSVARLPVTREVEGRVASQPGLVRIVSPVSGNVRFVAPAREGRIEAGERLFEIRQAGTGDTASGAASAQSALLRKRLRTSRERWGAEIERLEAQTRREREIRLPSLEASLQSAGRRFGILRQRQSLARRNLERLRTLDDGDLVEAERLIEAQSTEAAARLDLAELQESRRSLETEIAETRFAIAEAPRRIAIARARAADEEATIASELAGLEEESIVTLDAPVSGRLSSVVSDEEEAVSSGRNLAEIVPDGSALTVEFLVTSEIVGLIDEGTEVRLRYASYPYERFGVYDGRVVDVTFTPVATARTEEQSAGGRYRVTVRPDRDYVDDGSGRYDLRPGMAVFGGLVLYRKTILRWMFDPLGRALSRAEG